MKNTLLRFATFHRWLAGIALLLVGLLLGAYFFPWDLLREPINRQVSEQLGRRFEITQRLSVDLGRTTTVTAEGVEIVNPEWAHEPYLLKATAAEFDIELLPLLLGKVVLPRVKLTDPRIGLQIEPDGRRTWALSRDTSDASAVPQIGAVVVDQGTVSYRAQAQGADLEVLFSLAQEAGNALPLRYQASGQWNREAFSASGRAGGVLAFSQDTKAAFPLEIKAVAGKTRLSATGSISHLAALAGIDASFEVQGDNLDQLYGLAGVVLPSTPPYKVRGKLDKQGPVWSITQMQGLLGKSDIGGSMRFDQSPAVPLLTGKLQSKVMDFADLAPAIGMAPSGGPALRAKNKARASGKVLPRTPVDVRRLKAMNADLTYSAADIRHIKALPLDKVSVHVKLDAGVLRLEPLSLGVAGGTVTGSVRVDSTVSPPAFVTRLDVRGVQLNRLFPTVKTTQSSLGKISGQFDLNGRGDTLAQMLGSASGDMAVLMGRGEISNILLEFMGLDGGEVIKFLVRGDNTVRLRCAAAAFDVKQGLMRSRAIVLDTSDTVITGQGQISLANETLDILLKPEPKDMSILSVRSPLRIGGTFAKPTAGPETSALAGRIGIALALAVINPLLALAATIETGPGENADCAAILARASNGKK